MTHTSKAEHKSLPKKQCFTGCLNQSVSSLQAGDTGKLEYRNRAITAPRFTPLNQHAVGETGLQKTRSDVQEQDVLILQIALLSALLHALSGIIIPAWGSNSSVCSVLVKHLRVVQSAKGAQHLHTSGERCVCYRNYWHPAETW